MVAQTAGITPMSLFGGAKLPAWLGNLPSEVTLVTYMFLHGDWWHLGGNMLFLWVFGDNIEDAMGSIRFTAVLSCCRRRGGIGACLYESGIGRAADRRVGRDRRHHRRLSDALSARAHVVVGVHAHPLKLPAFVVIGAWVATQIFFVYFRHPRRHRVVGAYRRALPPVSLLVVVFKRSDQPLVRRRAAELRFKMRPS